MQQYMWQKLCKNNKKVNKKNKNNGFKPLAATVLLKRQFLKKQICLPECLQALLLLLSHLQAPHLAKHLPALLSPEKSRDESYTFNSKIKKLIQVKMHHRASSSYSVSGNTHKRTLFWFYYTWWKIFLHIREKKQNKLKCTDVSNKWKDRPCWRGSVCKCPSAAGCGTPSPRCGPGASSSGWWWQLSPRCSGSLLASICRGGMTRVFKLWSTEDTLGDSDLCHVCPDQIYSSLL